MSKLISAIARAKSRHESVHDKDGASKDIRKGKKTVISQSAALKNVPTIEYDIGTLEKSKILIPDLTRQWNAYSAAFRTLRTRVLQRARTNYWNSIAITSPTAGDGKTVVALNLAIAIAREKNSDVFLVDFDMRNSKLCEYLGAVPPVDIIDYFEDNATGESLFFSIGVDYLYIASTTRPSDRASELLASGRVEALLESINQMSSNALILIDLPPILLTDDALVVAPKVDACLLVVAEGVSKKDHTAKAVDLFSEYNLVGVISNRSHSTIKDNYGPS